MRCEVLASPGMIGEIVARDIAWRMEQLPRDRPFLLGCPSGRSPGPVYAALAGRKVDLPRLVIVMMDEYLQELPTGRAHVDVTALHSCRRFAREQIAAVLGAGRAAGEQIPPANIWLPDPADPQAYDSRIAAHGGIDLFILASGAGDGHVGFNPPGSERDSRTRIVTLAEQTRRDNMVTFPHFRSLDAVPRTGVTVGVSTIADQSRAAVMILWGAGKRVAWKRISRATRYEPDWPASIIAECRDAIVYGDRAACAD